MKLTETAYCLYNEGQLKSSFCRLWCSPGKFTNFLLLLATGGLFQQPSFVLSVLINHLSF